MKAIIVVATALVAATLTAPAVASDAPFPMNPYPGPSVDYVFNLQTLTGHGSKVKPAKYCAQQSVFQRGNQIVFRMTIVDAKTGKVMNGKDLSRVVIRITGQPDLVTGFKPQGGKPDATAPWLWSAAWVVPADYPVGTLKFDIVAKVKKTGKLVTYDPVVPGTLWEITP